MDRALRRWHRSGPTGMTPACSRTRSSGSSASARNTALRRSIERPPAGPCPSGRRVPVDRRPDRSFDRGGASGGPRDLHRRRGGRDPRPNPRPLRGAASPARHPRAGACLLTRRAARRGARDAGAAHARLPRLRHDGHGVEPAGGRLLERGPGRGHRPAGGNHSPNAASGHGELRRERQLRPPRPHQRPPDRNRRLGCGRGGRPLP